jgi:hypothetical protein
MASATWSTQPDSGDWNTAANWTPAGVPTETASFGPSHRRSISFSQTGAAVRALVFAADAPAYTFHFGPAAQPSLSIGGAGVSNQSSSTQSFVVAATATGYKNPQLQFTGTASAGGANVHYSAGPLTPSGYGGGVIGFRQSSTAGSAQFTVTTGAGAPPSGSTVGGEVSFSDTATAGTATFTVYGSTGTADQGDTFGNVVFHQRSSADHGTFISIGGTLPQCDGGNTQFYDSASASHGTFHNRGGTSSSANGGDVAFDGTSDGGYGKLINYAAPVAGAYGGVTSFNNNEPTVTAGGASAGSATIINCGASGSELGGGGHTKFSAKYGWPTAGSATIINYGSTVSGSTDASGAGYTIFSSPPGESYYPTAGSATIRNYASPSASGSPGSTEFMSQSNVPAPNYPRAGRAVLINEGGSVHGALGGVTTFYGNSSAEEATLIAYGGQNGGCGGQIVFGDQSVGGAASLQLYGNGTLTLRDHQGPLSLGSAQLSGGVLSTQLGSSPTTLTLSGLLSVAAGPVTFDFVLGDGFQSGTRYPILTASNLGSFPLSSFAGVAPSGLSPTFSIDGSTLYVSLS